jgi:hypothetical protein
MENINPDILNKMRMQAAGGGDEEVEGSGGVGKFSPEELAIGRDLVAKMDPELLDAMLQLPEDELEELITKELEKNDVDDVDVPDIIDIMRDIRDERGASKQAPPKMAPPKTMPEEEPEIEPEE